MLAFCSSAPDRSLLKSAWRRSILPAHARAGNALLRLVEHRPARTRSRPRPRRSGTRARPARCSRAFKPVARAEIEDERAGNCGIFRAICSDSIAICSFAVEAGCLRTSMSSKTLAAFGV
jgi:hypothetical protein